MNKKMDKLWLVELEYTPAQEYGEDVHMTIGKISAQTYTKAKELVEEYLGRAYIYACNHNKTTTGYAYVTYATYSITCIDDIYSITKDEG